MTIYNDKYTWKPFVWVVVYYLLYIAVYYNICLRNGLHWDEVLDLDGSANDTYCAAGRWSLWMYKAIFGKGALLSAAGFIAGVFISIAAVIQSSLLNLKAPWLKVLYGILLMTSYQWAAQLHYSHQSDAVALGLLMCTIAAGLACKARKPVLLVLAALLLGIAIGFYQSLALMFAVVWIAACLADSSKPFFSSGFRRIVVAGAISIGGIAFWMFTKAVLINFISPATQHWVQSYQTGLSEWTIVLASHDLSVQLGILWHYLRLSLSNASGLGKASYWIFVTALIPLAGLLLRQMRSKRGWDRIVSYLLTLALWWIPFSLPFFMMSPAMAIRTWLAEPFAFAAIWLLWVKDLQVPNSWRVVYLSLAAALMACTTVKVYREARIEADSHKATLTMLGEMYQRAMDMANQKGVRSPDIVVFGFFDKKDNPNLNTNVFRDAFPFDFYCKGFGMTGMRHATPQDEETYAPQVEAMPKWPEPGCVSNAGETAILIRLPHEK